MVRHTLGSTTLTRGGKAGGFRSQNLSLLSTRCAAPFPGRGRSQGEGLLSWLAETGPDLMHVDDSVVYVSGSMYTRGPAHVSKHTSMDKINIRKKCSARIERARVYIPSPSPTSSRTNVHHPPRTNYSAASSPAARWAGAGRGAAPRRASRWWGSRRRSCCGSGRRGSS